MLRILVITALLSPLGPAQEYVSWWDKPYQEAFVEARARNVPLLIAFIQDNEEANDRIVAGLYQDPDFIKLTRKCIPLVASIGKHPPMKMTVRGHMESCCSRFGVIKCIRHREVDRYARPKYWPTGEVKTPSHVVVLPDGKEVGRLIDVHGASAFAELVAKAQKTLGRGLDAGDYEKALDELKRATADMKAGRVAEVIARLVGIEGLVRKHPLEKKVDAFWKRVNQEGRMVLERAGALEKDDRVLEALRLLRESVDAYRGARVRKALQSSEKRLGRTAAGRRASRLLAREERARPIFEKAREADQEGDWVRAAAAYERVIDMAAETPLAEEAKKRLEGLRKDPDIGKLLERVRKEKAAAGALRDALRLIERGEKAAGRAALEKIVESFPGTPAAGKAKEALEKSG